MLATKTLRIVVCDDEPMSLETNTKFCRAICEGHDIDLQIKGYKSGNDLMFDLEDPRFQSTLDILLLDVTMPGLNGVDVAREARRLGYRGIIIFITASREHYTDAFDVGAFHYISKEDSFKRFEEIILRAVELSNETDRDELMLSGWGEHRKFKLKNIEYFRVADKHMTVYSGGDVFEFQGSLGKLENRLAGCGFYRIHRGYLVSLSYVKSINFQNVTMTNGEILPVGRKYYSGLKEAFNGLSI